MTTDAIVVMITARDQAEAQKISRHLLTERLAACVNMIPGVTSLFWWEGRIDESREVLLLVKSRRPLMSRIVAAARSQHSYEVPEILALPIEAGHDDYLNWIKANVKDDDLS